MSVPARKKKSQPKSIKRKISLPKSSSNVVELDEVRNFKGLVKIASKYMDGETLDEFTKYLQDNAETLKNPPIFKEKLRYGAPWMERNAFMSNEGIANPEIIPIEVFDKMKLDGQIAIGLAAIKQPVSSLTFRVECEDESQKAFIEKAIKPVWRSFLSGCLTSVDYGFSVMEKIFQVKKIKIEKFDTSEQKTKILFNDNGVVLKKLKNIHPKTIKFKFHKKTQEVVGLEQNVNLNYKKIKVKKNKILIYTNEGQFGNIYGKSRLAFAYTFWYWSLIVYQFMLRYLERRGTPPTVIRHPTGFTEDPTNPEAEIDNSDLALKSGQALLSNSVITFPSERDEKGHYVWDAEYLQDEPRQELFIDVLNHLHTMKLRALYVPERVLTQDFGTGSFALADAHFNVHLQVQEGLISCIEDKANELVKEIQELNFSEGEIKECVLKIERLDFAKRTVFRDIMVHLLRMNNNFARAGVIPRYVPDIKEIAKLLEIPVNNLEDMFTEGTFPIPGTPQYQAAVEAAKEQASEESDSSSAKSHKFPESKGSKKKEEKVGAPSSNKESSNGKPSSSKSNLKEDLDIITRTLNIIEKQIAADKPSKKEEEKDTQLQILQAQLIELQNDITVQSVREKARKRNLRKKRKLRELKEIKNAENDDKSKNGGTQRIVRDEKGRIKYVIGTDENKEIVRDDKGRIKFIMGNEEYREMVRDEQGEVIGVTTHKGSKLSVRDDNVDIEEGDV